RRRRSLPAGLFWEPAVEGEAALVPVAGDWEGEWSATEAICPNRVCARLTTATCKELRPGGAARSNLVHQIPSSQVERVAVIQSGARVAITSCGSAWRSSSVRTLA